MRDRFEQVRIVREDIAYVVAHRLAAQERRADRLDHRAPARLHPLYSALAERLEEFARLFPVHPAYLETFERVYVAEKRVALKTLSQAMRQRLDEEVPEDRPRRHLLRPLLVQLRDDPTMRTVPQVAEVADKSRVLAGRVRHAYTRAHLQGMAQRIIAALSVQRLTTTDIRAPLGVTAEELRDGLCLYTPLPEEAATATFLLGQVQVALQEMMRTVSGQYITHNPENGQYYLDVDKDVDFAARIAERGDFLSDDDLNRYFFDALQPLLPQRHDLRHQLQDLGLRIAVGGAQRHPARLPFPRCRPTTAAPPSRPATSTSTSCPPTSTARGTTRSCPTR